MIFSRPRFAEALGRSLLGLAAAGLLAGGASQAAAAGAGRAPRLLIIAIDAVPHRTVARLTDPSRGEAALFKGFAGPAALLNAFPGNSPVAWSGLLEAFGVHKPLGYEARYFDLGTRSVRAGYTLEDEDAPWQGFFDWRLKGVMTHAIAYGRPHAYAAKELNDGLEAFLRSDKPVFAMYIISTDGIGHRYGPEALGDFLGAVDRALAALRRSHPDMPFRTVLLSDHGMAGGKPLVNVLPAVRESLAGAGFRERDQVRESSDVALVTFGLLSSFVLHARPGHEMRAARAAAAAAGVDLCVARDPAGWRVVSSRGEALVSREGAGENALWAYRPLSGDPLEYRPVLASLRRDSGAARGEWFSDRAWFDASSRHRYPDALYRLARGFELVENPASGICSVGPGHMFGAALTETTAALTIGRLQWTHGALHRDASVGFLMTDVPGWPLPPALRFDQALRPLARLLGREHAPARGLTVRMSP